MKKYLKQHHQISPDITKSLETLHSIQFAMVLFCLDQSPYYVVICVLFFRSVMTIISEGTSWVYLVAEESESQITSYCEGIYFFESVLLFSTEKCKYTEESFTLS